MTAWMNDSKGARTRACALLASAVLAACGGGDDTPPAMVAGADTATLSAGQTAQLLANDTIGGAAAVSGSNVTFSVTTSPLPTGVTLVAGVLSVDATAVPGTSTIAYKICDVDHADNCASANVTLTVPPPAIVATNDTLTVSPGGSGDVLANDTLGGAAATAATVAATATGTLPSGVALSAGGVLAVAGSTTPGSYSIGYSICQTGLATNCASATIALTVPAIGALGGRVVDEMTGAGIAGVRVSASGLSATTDSDGSFSLGNVGAQDRISVVFDGAGHAQTARIASVTAGATSDLQVRMLPVGISASVPVAAGGTVSLPTGPGRVVLPANGVQRVSDGSIPSGDMTVALTAIDPASNTAQMPGDFTTMQAGAAVPIESFGAINVQLSDSSGAALNLRSGQTATIRIPLSSRNPSAPATIPLFWYDTAAGRWVQEGTATLDATNSYYEGTVSHFTTWNADQTYNSINVTGCVKDAAGNPLANAFLQTDGVDYSGTSSARSAADGSFVLPMRKSSLATLVGLSAGRLTNTLRIGAYAADTTLTDCLVLGQNGAGVTMTLTWGAAPSDLDSHLYAPDGSHVYYSNKGALLAAPFANLDVDDTSSYGPEVVTLTKLMVGTYKYSVRNYSGQGSGLIGASGARVVLTVPGRNNELYVPPGTGESTSTEWWNLFEMDVDASCGITVRRVGSYSVNAPTAASGNGTPQYCTLP